MLKPANLTRTATSQRLLRTCTLRHAAGFVTIGWSNVFRFGEFAAAIDRRIANGSRYVIVLRASPAGVLYNNATKINMLGSERQLDIARLAFPEFLLAGDISIVPTITETVVGPVNSGREVLLHDTMELLGSES